ncbi:hypothetical protein [Streptomyces justiciae]|uniref:Hedgehog N-terminal signalling domain-containing protein n=1 Tax=Streptomyces justiciae TaxID=2780140 RepID=A0ABU3M2A0_9ACTN|nr:hypothetical protein [Streptomyces justiciae]MDT7845630.1 hypothetical protein [Streptomyces justiciae]
MNAVMLDLHDVIKSSRSPLDAADALRMAPTALIGVDTVQAEVLADLGITTVFDLAISDVFAAARALTDAAENPLSVLARFGRAGAGVLSEAAAGKDIDEIADLGLGALTAFCADSASTAGSGPAAHAETTLGVSSVRDLAQWPPHLAARLLFDHAFAPAASKAAGEDPEATPDLVPGNGDYPTERVYYSTLLMDRIEGTRPRDLRTSGPLDPTEADGQYGFDRPAEGALLTYSQSWYGQGLALGQLLHSLALAPGEATRVAMLDWSRRTAGQRDETGSQVEDLTNTTTHTRALSEVARSVAEEAQSGFSRSTLDAHSRQTGTASGGLADWPSPLDFLNPFSKTPGVKLESTSTGEAWNTSTATSFAASSGRREINAFMAQNIADATHQAAHAARSRRATVVEEVQESESVSTTTRIVANYNHMHALTVCYYEVVQLYRVEVALQQVEKCLFVPVRVLDFQAPEKLDLRQRTVLGEHALTPFAAKELLYGKGYVGVMTKPRPGVTDPPRSGNPKVVLPDQETFAAALGEEARIVPERGAIMPADARAVALSTVGVPAGSDVLISTRDGSVHAFPVAEDGKAALGTALSWEDITSIGLQGKAEIPPQAMVSVDVAARTEAARKTATLSWVTGQRTPAGQTSVLATATSTGAAAGSDGSATTSALAGHLARHRLHYNQALWRSMDPATLALMLSPYTYNDRPLLEIIDPSPVTMVGNYLVFRMPTEADSDSRAPGGGADTARAAWTTWLKDHGLWHGGGVRTGVVRRDLVPLPSGGVFAEAVLGRSNSAEKLDMTRFWNWQDSPIPLQPTEIAPLSTGSRAQQTDLKPGEFSSPLVNIVAPTTLPDPQGMSGVLQAVAAANLFRDMSGLAATVGLAGKGVEATSEQAQQAAAQAGQNMKTAADFLTSVGAMIASAITKTPVSGPAQSSVSASGAALNQGKKLNEERGTGAGVPQRDGTPGQPPASGKTSGAQFASAGTDYEDLGYRAALGSGGGGGPLGTFLPFLLGATGQGANGGGTMSKPALALGQKVPDKAEAVAAGAIAAKVVRGTPEFDALVDNTNPEIVYKDEEGTGADRMMTPRLRDGLDALAALVTAEWPGRKLRVTEAWDEDGEHTGASLHYEGRAADLTVSDKDTAKLGRLAQLAVDAGLDWVWYENTAHVHVSVTNSP